MFVIVFFPVWQSLISVWSSSEDYSHGFFIVPISLYIIWMKNRELMVLNPAPSWVGFVLMLVSLLLYVVAQYGSILTLAPIAMVSFIISSVIFLYGFKFFYAILFPLCFLFLMIPIPSQIYSAATIPLQFFVTTATVEMSRLIGIPILREGNVIHLADTTMQVVAACSGLRSITSLFTLCAVFGYLTLRSNFFRIILCCSSVVAAILVNIFRVFGMILAHNYFQYDLTHGIVHTFFGITIFGLALAIVYFFQSILLFGEKRFASRQ